MKITHIECFPIKITPAQAYLGGQSSDALEDYYYRNEYRCVYSRKMETCLVKISTDTGHAGWGEALAPVTPHVAAEIILNLFKPILLGQNPHHTNVHWSRMYNSMRDRGYLTGFLVDAIAAVDCALWDLRGKDTNRPVHELLGGAYRQSLPCYVSGLPAPDIEERTKLAKEWIRKDFHAIKMALGYGVEEDLDNLSAIREAVGPDIELFIDAHWNYNVSEAVKLAKGLEKLEIGFLEAPILPEDYLGYAELRKKTSIPIALGESKRTRFEFRPFIDRRSVDILQPDVGRVGITEMMRIGFQAETSNLMVAPHLSVGLGPCIAASMQVAAALPNFFKLEFQPGVFESANSILHTPISCEKGHYTLPDKVGLGVEVNEEIVRNYAKEYKNA